VKKATGPIVDVEGRMIGSHDGHWRFTPGQRRGLGVGAGRPLYVLDTNPDTNTVVVGSRAALATTRVDTRGRLYVPVTGGEAKLRYRSAPVPATVRATADGFSLALAEPAYGVAGGQYAVVYDDDAVVGAGVITGVA
jgi:tRNA-uridine 2-sulfurtransferase